MADLTRMLAGLIRRRNDLLLRLFVGELSSSSTLVSGIGNDFESELLLELSAHVQWANNYTKFENLSFSTMIEFNALQDRQPTHIILN